MKFNCLVKEKLTILNLFNAMRLIKYSNTLYKIPILQHTHRFDAFTAL